MEKRWRCRWISTGCAGPLKPKAQRGRKIVCTVFDRIPAQRGGHRYARVLHADEQRLRNIQLQADSVVNAQVAVVENEHVIGEPSVGLFQFEIPISSAQASYHRIARGQW